MTSVYGPDKPVTLHMEYSELKESEKDKQEKINARNNKNVRKSVQGAINEANLLEANGLGPYRKVGMHVPKTKLYAQKDNKLEIPPECPMHNATDESGEIQLEMDFE